MKLPNFLKGRKFHVFHSWSVWGEPVATCALYAYQRRTCVVCGKIDQREIGYDYSYLEEPKQRKSVSLKL